MLKYYAKNFISTTCEDFHQPLYGSNKKRLEILMFASFGQLNEVKQF